MPFPLSPANNQTALVNGIVYQWNGALGVWKRNGSINSASIGQLLLTSAQQSTTNGSGTLIVSGGAGITGNVYTGGIFITGSANGITFPDGTVQTTAGVAVDAFARNTANSASSNTIILQGINTTQNTNITNADTKAQAAFDSANTKFSSSGGTITGDTVVTGNLTVTGTQFYANTVNLTVVDNIITLNSNVTGAPTLSAGIEVNRGSSTNTKLLWSEANTAWEFTNDGTTYEKIAGLTYVNAAFNQANVTAGGLISANSRLTIIEGVDVSQNTRMTIIEGVNTWQNTEITNITSLAQSAFNTANSAGTDTYARTTANAAFIKANSANVLAQAAFDKANTSAAAVNTTGPNPPASGNNVGDIWYSTLDDTTYRYTYDGTSYYWIDLTTTPSSSSINVLPNYLTRIYQGDGSTNTFTISANHTANTIMVFNNGVCQFPIDDYTVNGTTLTYVLTPEADETIQIRELPNIFIASTTPFMRRYVANGVQTQFTVTSGQTANTMFVFENGICQVPVADYTVSGTTLTFLTAPTADRIIQIREMPIV